MRSQLTRIKRMTDKLPPLPKPVTRERFEDSARHWLNLKRGGVAPSWEQALRLEYDWEVRLRFFAGFAFDISELGISIDQTGRRSVQDLNSYPWEIVNAPGRCGGWLVDWAGSKDYSYDQLEERLSGDKGKD